MTFFADEVVSIPSGPAKSLTNTKYDNSGGAKAARVVLTAFSAPVAYRYETGPDTASKSYHLLSPGDAPLVVDGYDNIVNLRLALASGSTTAQVFASYAA